MSHDLHFTVQNGDGSQMQQQTNENSLREGEMDHLPDHRSDNHPQSSSSIQYLQEKLKQSSHPAVIIFHLLFKGIALFLYIFGGWFVSSNSADSGPHFITLTVVMILLLAADFWVVKNVTGRLLVGLRWWNKVEGETTTWIFESAEDKTVNVFDRSVFWTVLYAYPCVWAGLFVLGLLRLKVSWLMIVVIALALSISNVYGYYKCSTDQRAKFQQMMQTGAQRGAMAMVSSSVMGMLSGTAGRNPASSAPSSRGNYV